MSQCRAKCSETDCDNRCEGTAGEPLQPGERHACMTHDPSATKDDVPFFGAGLRWKDDPQSIEEATE